jgi:hypothetical protein
MTYEGEDVRRRRMPSIVIRIRSKISLMQVGVAVCVKHTRLEVRAERDHM